MLHVEPAEAIEQATCVQQQEQKTEQAQTDDEPPADIAAIDTDARKGSAVQSNLLTQEENETMEEPSNSKTSPEKGKEELELKSNDDEPNLASVSSLLRKLDLRLDSVFEHGYFRPAVAGELFRK